MPSDEDSDSDSVWDFSEDFFDWFSDLVSFLISWGLYFEFCGEEFYGVLLGGVIILALFFG